MSRLLDPKILLSVKNLQLAAKTTVDGFMAGINSSRSRGEGMEFNQYRSYQPGDDLRQLDWKLYARTDRYFVKEAEMENSIAVRFILDATASMNHQDNGHTKIEYARWLAASLGWLAALQGDAVGLTLLQQDTLFQLDAKRTATHMNAFYHALENVEATGSAPDATSHAWDTKGKKGLLIFITDLYEEHDELVQVLRKMAMMKHEVIVFHIMGDNELNFSYADYKALEDLETGRRVKINGAHDAAGYKKRLDEQLATIKSKMLDQHFFYRLINMRQPLDQALRDFLKQRSKVI